MSSLIIRNDFIPSSSTYSKVLDQYQLRKLIKKKGDPDLIELVDFSLLVEVIVNKKKKKKRANDTSSYQSQPIRWPRIGRHETKRRKPKRKKGQKGKKKEAKKKKK